MKRMKVLRHQKDKVHSQTSLRSGSKNFAEGGPQQSDILMDPWLKPSFYEHVLKGVGDPLLYETQQQLVNDDDVNNKKSR